jgi:hypothetical protein
MKHNVGITKEQLDDLDAGDILIVNDDDESVDDGIETIYLIVILLLNIHGSRDTTFLDIHTGKFVGLNVLSSPWRQYYGEVTVGDFRKSES